MMKKNERTLGRRGFLILSGAGATSMAFASSAMGREAVNAAAARLSLLLSLTVISIVLSTCPERAPASKMAPHSGAPWQPSLFSRDRVYPVG